MKNFSDLAVCLLSQAATPLQSSGVEVASSPSKSGAIKPQHVVSTFGWVRRLTERRARHVLNFSGAAPSGGLA